MLHLLSDNNKGSTIIITLFMTSILAIIGATFTSMVIFQLRNAPWQLRRTQGFYLAEAGLDECIVLLRDDVDWSNSGCGDSGCGDGSPTHHFDAEGEWYPLYDPNAGGDVDDIDLGDGAYSVQICNPVGSDGKAINIRAEGAIEESQRTLQLRIQLQGWAAFGEDGLRMAGHPTIDSYDSDDGLYEDQAPGQNGNVGSNEDIELKGNCT